MIFGTVVGTYSSIFIASPLLYDFNKDKELKIIEKKKYNPDDKIVV
jgi:preprotein translocase subunit SecF